MASFLTDLWESIFVPGPTPTLLRAANFTFAALQLLLLILLIATSSVHFVALSILSAGLWWSINWFAAELALAAKQRDETGDAAAAAGAGDATAQQGAVDDSSDTEVEAQQEVVGRRSKRMAGVEPVESRGEMKHRGEASLAGTQSSVSTEDEWEKVSEGEKEKDK